MLIINTRKLSGSNFKSCVEGPQKVRKKILNVFHKVFKIYKDLIYEIKHIEI